MTEMTIMVIMNIGKFQAFSDELEAFVWPAEDNKQQLKRQRILFAATERFIQLGYRKTSIESIAKQAGLAKGTIYLYYNNKAEIVLHAIALEKLTHLQQLIEHISDNLSPRDSLRTFIVVAVVMSRQMPLTASLLRGDREILFALQEVDEQLKESVGRMRINMVLDLLDDATDHELPRARLKALGHTLVDLMHSIFLTQHTYVAEIPPIVYAQNLANMLIDGLLNTKNQSSPDSLQPLFKGLSERAL